MQTAYSQIPLTPGTGQYCSYYADGFTSDLGGILYLGSVHTYITDCSKDGHNQVCAGQSQAICPWSAGIYCDNMYVPYDYCGDNCHSCSNTEGIYYCSAGCVTVSPCTPISNAVFTGAAVPMTSATGCPFTCNTGYTKSGSSCIQQPTTPTCTVNQYYNGNACVACPVCPNGYYRSNCTDTNAGQCDPCTNT